ncbi:FUSC family protein [Subtercola sp. PAMC28395]|uniref:FUSC family protein n=1 Tax=Subtercola sp. PAMC28395 TaxID=2846775 RepID=UPI001C0BA693|nr:FUSC family protein [Subtercola sp. PAMC28395]QWT23938.1 FUSC family protein [Subtercola sp. PAMC28395]
MPPTSNARETASAGSAAKARAGGFSRWLGSATSAGFRRAGASAPAILQLVVAVVAAYSVTHYGLGHAAPITAVTVTLSSLGFVRDARPVRVLETAIGVTLGITLSELILMAFGQGIWQLGVSVAVTLFAARIISPAPGFAVIAGVQSALVAMLPAVQGGPFTRTIDGLVGGAIALLVTALIPRDPRRFALADARRVLRVFSDIVSDLVIELRRGPENDVDRVLEDARRTQPLIDQWRASLESALGIARISPFLRRRLPELKRQKVMLAGVDLAIRDLRVVIRRLSVIMRDGQPRPQFADLFDGLVGALSLLEQSLTDPMVRPLARQHLILIAVRLDPDELFPENTMVEISVVLELRPLVMDLLTATGLSVAEARASLPTLPA